MTDRAHRRAARRRAFTLVEAVLAALVVAIVLVGAMHAVGASGADQARAAQRAGAATLAEGLLSEILSKKYDWNAVSADAAAGVSTSTGTMGSVGAPDAGMDPSRQGYGCVDDFNGLVDSPPHDVEGRVIAGFLGWSREVTVLTVSAADGQTLADPDQGAKLVTVTVKRAGATVTTRVALVTNAP